MVEQEITKLRTKLDNLILKGASYKEIYDASVELDELIMKFYKEKEGLSPKV